ncbi:MAG: N-acetyl-gamma-glutamyl-phosphate reductase [Clostridiales Family XIII bacterium]|jgi:N-acetyl-gamma-glutamyl-phosphate reductase|nr:N-acetyl-gamma-glutamyl-phosphate reductase [Clostridiales Family XIII bacterium]
MHKIFIDGKEGTTGLKIFDRFSSRDDIEVLEINPDLRKDLATRLELMRQADIAFLCLPDAGAKEIVDAVDDAGIDIRIIDASTAHRTDDRFAYGMPELSTELRQRIATTDRLANPGCHATGYILSVKPLLHAGLLSAGTTASSPYNTRLSCHTITGYSGGGKSMIAAYEEDAQRPADAKQLSAPRQYGLSQLHKHVPEMIQYSEFPYPPAFAPIVSNYYAGLLVSVPVYTEGRFGLADVHQALNEAYEDSPLIHVRDLDFNPESGFLRADAFAGRDDLEIIVTGNDDVIEIITRYDNLGKGASGAAIQNMNIMLGIEETKGLVVEKE